MKRFLILLAIFISSFAYAANNDDTRTFTKYNSGFRGDPVVFTISYVADSDGGNIRNFNIPYADAAWLMNNGYYFWKARTNPGSTAPTDNYDITVLDANGNDMANGELLNRDTSTTEVVNLTSAVPIVSSTMTITVSNNTVNSAIIVGELYFAK